MKELAVKDITTTSNVIKAKPKPFFQKKEESDISFQRQLFIQKPQEIESLENDNESEIEFAEASTDQNLNVQQEDANIVSLEKENNSFLDNEKVKENKEQLPFKEEVLEDTFEEENIMDDIPEVADTIEKEQIAKVDKLTYEGTSEQSATEFIEATPSQIALSYNDLGDTLNKKLKEDKTSSQEEAPILKAQSKGNGKIIPTEDLNIQSEIELTESPNIIITKQETPNHQNNSPQLDRSKVENLVDQIPEEKSGIEIESNFDAILNEVKTTDKGINTNAGKRPKINTTGEANLNRSNELKQESSKKLNTQKKQVVENLKKHPGQQNIKPIQLDESFPISLPSTESQSILTKESQALKDYSEASLPKDVRNRADEMMSPKIKSSLSKSKNDIDIASNNRNTEKQKEFSKAQEESNKLNMASEKEQKNIILDNRKKVEKHQEEGIKETQEKLKSFDKEAKSEQDNVKSSVENKIESAEKDADEQLMKGEADAKSKKAEAEKAATAEKEKLNNEKSEEGFFDKIASAIKSVLKAITDTITKIFDDLRKLVSSIINKAKELALGFIESARKWIVDRLNNFREWAKQKVNKYLKEFPLIAAKINDLIDKVVDVAVKGINVIADNLKSGVEALSKSLGTVLDKILSTFQTALTASVQIMGAVLTGDFAEALRIAIRAACEIAGVDPKTIFDFLDRAKERIMDILNDPVKFFGFLMQGVGDGVRNFGQNIKTHLMSGLIGWLTGALSSIAIKIPAKFDALGIFSMVTNILGLTYESLKARIIKRFPPAEKVFNFVEKAFTFVQDFLERGPIAIWERVKDALANIKDLVLGGIRSFIQSKVIKAGLIWLLSLTNPAGALIKVIKMLFDFVMFLKERFLQIKNFVMSIYETLAAIAQGNLSIVVKGVEMAMGRSIPVFISLFATILNIDGITKKIKEIIGKVTKPINNFIDGLITRVVDWVKNFIKGVKGKVKGAKDKIIAWWKVKKEFKAEDGENHKLYFKGKGKKAKLMVASDDPKTYAEFISSIDTEGDSNKEKIKTDAIGLAKEVDKIVKDPSLGKTTKDKDDKKEVIKYGLDKLAPLTAKLFGAEDGKLPITKKVAWNPKDGAIGVKMVAPLLTRIEGEDKGSETTSSVTTKTYDTLNKRSDGKGTYYVKGHLLNNNLHGPGNYLSNLVPLSREGNRIHEQEAERLVKIVVESGAVVSYTVTANFGRTLRKFNKQQYIDFKTREAENKGIALPEISVSEVESILAVREAEKDVPLSLTIQADLLVKSKEKEDDYEFKEALIPEKEIPNKVEQDIRRYKIKGVTSSKKRKDIILSKPSLDAKLLADNTKLTKTKADLLIGYIKSIPSLTGYGQIESSINADKSLDDITINFLLNSVQVLREASNVKLK